MQTTKEEKKKQGEPHIIASYEKEMSATAEQAPTPVDVVSKPAEKKNTSALVECNVGK